MADSSLSNSPLPRRRVMAAALGLPLLGGCFYDDYFDLKWEEEVQLHDGRIIVVALTHTFQRLKQDFSRYGGSIVHRDTELSFDAGPGVGRVTQLFKNFQPMLLDQIDDTWYAVILGAQYYGYRERTGQYWGESETGMGQRPLKLVQSKWQPLPIRDLPPQLTTSNFIHFDRTERSWTQLNGKRVTIGDKRDWKKKYPPHPPLNLIVRPVNKE